uniref:Murine leukemia virus integrase C-terminal domain-containing protein n=1 Tax=Cyprinodon variegatus TaxID=28743 RepID=A0A3Q2GLI2_CYPVA
MTREAAAPAAPPFPCHCTELWKQPYKILFNVKPQVQDLAYRVLIKIIKRKTWKAPRWEGPYIMQLTTPTALSFWSHSDTLAPLPTVSSP